MRLPGRFLSIVASVCVLFAVSATATSARSTAGARRYTALEAAIAREVNATRAARGLASLGRSTALSRAADMHTIAMFDTGRFDHELPGMPSFAQRMRRFYGVGAPVWSGAENLALFGPAAPSAQDVVAAWLASSPHRTNLLDRSWRELGVAVRFSDASGGDFRGQPTWLITLDLGRRG